MFTRRSQNRSRLVTKTRPLQPNVLYMNAAVGRVVSRVDLHPSAPADREARRAA
jgi:hypothetical protein